MNWDVMYISLLLGSKNDILFDGIFPLKQLYVQISLLHFESQIEGSGYD